MKVLLYYTPHDPAEINEEKHAFVERIGDECRTNDIPFFLEFMGYGAEGRHEKGLEAAKVKPGVVAGSIAEFTRDRYSVDVMKVEIPIDMKFVEGTQSYSGDLAYTRAEAIEHFRAAAHVATKPFIFLSAGVSNAEFTESLELAAESGVNWAGVLCGRATWKEGIPVFAREGVDAFRRWLETEGAGQYCECQRTSESGGVLVRHLRGGLGRRADHGVSYIYHSQVLEQLALHGVTPTPTTRPELVHEFVSDLYRFELRQLRQRQVEGQVDKRDYAAHVVVLRRKYVLISVPIVRWTVQN